MKRFLLLAITVSVFAIAPAADAQFILDNSGVMNVQVLASQSGAQPGNNTVNWLSVWNTNPTGTGIFGGFNITHNEIDTEVSFDYPNGGGNFGVNRGLDSINSNGPGGAGGSFGPGGDNYSVRAQTFLQFTQAGTYTIAMGSDDGRLISLTEAAPGSAPGYSNFTARFGQFPGNNPPGGFPASFTPGVSTSIGFSDGTGHDTTRGVFTVAAGDILALDAFYYEGGGGDSGEISLAQGSQSGFTAGNGAGQFQLLTDNMFNGAVQLSTAIQAVPEPASVALWSLIGASLAGFISYRARRCK